MSWDHVRSTFADESERLADLLESIEHWDRPALGQWSVAELTAHVVRAATRIAEYSTRPVRADDRQLPSAASYFVAYLDEGEAGRGAVAERSITDAVTLEDPARRFRQGAADSLRVMHGTDDGLTPLATPFGVLALDEYAKTRILEFAIHGLDLAHALGTAWRPSGAAMDISLAVLTDLAAERHVADALLGVLTGRAWAEHDEVIPLLF